MGKAVKLVEDRGLSILIFPEGGRSLTGLKPFNEGAAYIAIKAGIPIIPMALMGTLEVLPMHSLNVRPGKVVLRIGEPIPTIGLTLRDRERLTATLRERVVELLEAGQPVLAQR